MKPHYYKLPKHFHESVLIRKDITLNFYQKWHYHDEIEIVYILKGKGTRFIGDNISNFTDGDLLLVGAYLPHLWKNEKPISENWKKDMYASAIVIQFPVNLGGDGFLNISEMTLVKKLLEDSKLGIYFKLPENHKIKKLLKKMVTQSSFDRFISLLTLLKDLSECEKKSVLSSVPFADYYQKHKSKRIDEIYDFILNNFHKEIKLEELASIANMTTTSLCRFFKQSTQKSLSTFINEVRIGYSCKLLIDDKLSISDVCFSCGYNNLSYFNRQFKKIIRLSPSQYQSQISLNKEV